MSPPGGPPCFAGVDEVLKQRRPAERLIGMRARFGDCVLDTEARELRRGGRPVELSPKGIALLILLLTRRPAAVTQEGLRDALWPEAHVGYTSLARVVSEVRKALGEAAGSASLIRTVPRFGYAFAAEAVIEGAASGPSRFLLVAEGWDFAVAAGEVLIGRGPECALRLPSAGVSRVHASLHVGDRGALLRDRDSKNGTWVNGVRIAAPVVLAEGDEVLIGSDRFVFRSSATMDSTRTASPR
jgi:DNA-binding winged helix-turn-helix (wHTH) protein